MSYWSFGISMSDIPPDRIHVEINAEITAKIDALIEEELYPDRAAFIEQAIQNQLRTHQTTFDKYKKQKSTVIGMLSYSAEELEKIIAKGKRLEIRTIGILRFSDDVTPELFDKAVAKINLAGRLWAPDSILPMINERRYTLLGKPYRSFRELDAGNDIKKLPE
jgi:Arc/MetJ-type ribon-helix-helix transcriptional regulator